MGLTPHTVLGMVVDRDEEALVKAKAAERLLSVSDYLRDQQGFNRRGKRGVKKINGGRL